MQNPRETLLVRDATYYISKKNLRSTNLYLLGKESYKTTKYFHEFEVISGTFIFLDYHPATIEKLKILYKGKVCWVICVGRLKARKFYKTLQKID